MNLSGFNSLAIGDIPPSQRFPLSELEAKRYYNGLPSAPVLVARTGTPWILPSGPEAYLRVKELRPIGNHMLKDVWEGKLASELHTLLDLMKVKWTSTDVVRIGHPGESFAPIILWIGVTSTSLSQNDGLVAASECQKLLMKYSITDVDVEIRESVISRSAGPQLLTSTWSYSSEATVDARESHTPMLGLPICAQSTPWVEGTGGFFITAGEDTERLLLVTARHVVFPPDKNNHFVHDSQPHHNVMLFGNMAFRKYLESIKRDIIGKAVDAETWERLLECIEEKYDPGREKELQKTQARLSEDREAMEELNIVRQDVLTHWAPPENRLLGHVILSPPINVRNSDGYTEDWAIIEIDTSKVNAANFKGNAINLGGRISRFDFTCMIEPDPQYLHTYKYPIDRLLRLQGTIPDEEMRNPPTLDQNGDPCLTVTKRGNTTGLTVGRASGVFSYIRSYLDDDEAKTSKQWAILPFDARDCHHDIKRQRAWTLQHQPQPSPHCLAGLTLVSCVVNCHICITVYK